MGFKTTNYVTKRKGLRLPEAYAVITNINVNRAGKSYADFGIHISRDSALLYEPIEQVRVTFTSDVNENAYVTAYKAAKAVKQITTPSGLIREHHGPFYGWDDDIVEV